MERPPYFPVRELVGKIDRPAGAREGCLAILDEHEKLFKVSLGSTHNHQAWVGGYFDHVGEVMNLAVLLFPAFQATGRDLAFTLSDALLVLFLHDLEKPWKYTSGPDGKILVVEEMANDKDKEHAYRMKRAKEEYGIAIDSRLENAIRFTEGEGDRFKADRRVSNELAAFCHLCDHASARVWHEHPLDREDPWSGTRPSMRD